MKGFYEYERDHQRLPSCWKTVNDVCLPHFHSSIELLYVTKGEVSSLVDGRLFEVEAGSFLISPSYAVHSNQTEKSSESYVLTIPLEAIPSYKALLSKKTFDRCCCRDRSGGELQHCMRMLGRLSADEKSVDSVYKINMIKGYVYVLLGYVLEETGLRNFEESSNASLARAILSYLQENYQSEISLDLLAKTFGYSKSRFSHLFHQYFGSGISEYVNDLRCRMAVDAVARRELSMVEIAMSVGFESVRTFYRAFRRCYGMSPSQYAERHVETGGGMPHHVNRSGSLLDPEAFRLQP